MKDLRSTPFFAPEPQMTPSRFLRTENNVYYLEGLDVPTPTVAPEVAHYILVVDRSGSMCGDIERLKQSIEQALAVESMMNSDVLVSLISFSTHGDVTLHWSKVKASKILELSQPYINILRSIRATYLTGISQALHMALQQVDFGQTTGITLFTDGYANSPSSYEENKNLDAFIRKAAEAPRLFLNCIGYRDWCDWPRLNAMTNALSGKTVKANSFKDVLDAIKDTRALLSGNMRPAIKIAAPEAGVTLLAVNRSTGQVNSTTGELILRGAGSEDLLDIYAVRKGDKTYTIPKGIVALEKEEANLFAALAIAAVNSSEIRAAKELLFASGNKTLWEAHQGAITPSSLSAMLTDLSTWVQVGTNEGYDMGRNVRPKFNLFDLASAINNLPERSVGIPVDEFYGSYRRRSIKRVEGSREEGSTAVIPPKARTVPKPGERVYVSGVSFNTSDASVQLDTQQAVQLQRVDTGEILGEVNYVNLSGLKDHRSYTLVSSGERNVEVLPLEVYNKQAWESLSQFVIASEARDFEPGKTIRIELKRFRMESDEVPKTTDLFASMATRIRAEASIKAYSAMQDKAEASPYTAEQVASLKELHLSEKLNFSPPTCNHYADRDEAIAKGEIDSFTRYKVFFGTTEILSSGELKSGNAFLDRRYVALDSNGVEIKKPKLATYLKGDTYKVKANSKAKDSPADTLMAEVFDDILIKGPRLTNEQIGQKLSENRKIVEKANALTRGLVMEVGCTGLLPSDLEKEVTRYEPEAFAEKFGVKLGKDEAEGIYYVASNGLVISIIPETSWYTTATVAA